MSGHQKPQLITMGSMTGSVFVWSAVRPYDVFTWWLEVLPVIIGVIVLMLTHKTFPLTRLAYWLLAIHAVILMVGGHYTYAHVPLFDGLKEIFGWTRNNYDKVGHFAQGFIPAIITREVLLRKTALINGKMLFFLVICVCSAISATYELIEWLTAVGMGSAADEFLGSQGDVWDTQQDMAWALVGSVLAQITLSKWHDAMLQHVVK